MINSYVSLPASELHDICGDLMIPTCGESYISWYQVRCFGMGRTKERDDGRLRLGPVPSQNFRADGL